MLYLKDFLNVYDHRCACRFGLKMFLIWKNTGKKTLKSIEATKRNYVLVKQSSHSLCLSDTLNSLLFAV